jgi:hypothetical protein
VYVSINYELIMNITFRIGFLKLKTAPKRFFQLNRLSGGGALPTEVASVRRPHEPTCECDHQLILYGRLILSNNYRPR